MRDFVIVEVDGQLAAAYSHFGIIASALFDRSLKVPPTYSKGAAPETLRNYAQIVGLGHQESDYLRQCIAGIKDFWLSLPAKLMPLPQPTLPTIYRVRRLDTKGKPVLQQTVEWLEKLGIHDPIVWREDEE